MGPATAHLYRLYDGTELGDDGYPPVWHQILKHEVRADAGHRCIRCLHPFVTKESARRSSGKLVQSNGEWSPCDDRCRHADLVRVVAIDGPAVEEKLADPTTLQSYLADGFTVEAAWRILTVHHLDMNKANCRWWNLAPLCQRCHLEIQWKVKMSRRWLHEHSAWFQPYVAAYYAFVYLDEDLTRDETLARLAELLDLEHRQEALL